MLAIMRKPGEGFTIGKNIEIFIVSVRGSKVIMSIDAPRHLPILRDNAINRAKKPVIAEHDNEKL